MLPTCYLHPAHDGGAQYDGDQSGCVTHSEFIMMLRDLEALPTHYAPEDDPEALLARAAAKKWVRVCVCVGGGGAGGGGGGGGAGAPGGGGPHDS